MFMISGRWPGFSPLFSMIQPLALSKNTKSFFSKSSSISYTPHSILLCVHSIGCITKSKVILKRHGNKIPFEFGPTYAIIWVQATYGL